MNFSVIIVAAGNSERMGFDKLLAPLAGKPVLQHSIETFASCNNVSKIIVVCPEDRYREIGLKGCSKNITRVDGGKDRHDSVAAGLRQLAGQTQYVAVHDGARPLVSLEQIQRVMKSALTHDAASSARPVTETIKRASSDDFAIESICRDHLWLMETPQIFRTDLLNQAYQLVQQNGQRVTDEVSAMELIEVHTHLVANREPNLKITYPEDIQLAEKLIS
jgi:2-C-methyl-D-erythritol 4-phosphate cytidylyltransferase